MNNAPPQSITILFQQLREGDADSAGRLWDRFFERLVRYAQSEMKHMNRRVSDEEDIACGVMTALCNLADRKKLPNIDNRHDLWHLLLSWTRHDIIDQVRKDNRVKRGGGNVRGDSVLSDGVMGAARVIDSAPTPDLVAEMQEQYRRLLDCLPDELLRTLAVEKMHGTTNARLAKQLDLSTRTIERKLELIRKFWSRGNAGTGSGVG